MLHAANEPDCVLHHTPAKRKRSQPHGLCNSLISSESLTGGIVSISRGVHAEPFVPLGKRCPRRVQVEIRPFHQE